MNAAVASAWSLSALEPARESVGLVVPLRPEDAPAVRTDAELVDLARRGDEKAKETLYRRHARLVIGLSHRVLGRPEEVDDLAQDTFLQAFERLDTLSDGQAFASWVATICVRGARKRIQREALRRRIGLRRKEPIDADGLVSPRASPDTRTELLGIYRILESLPADTRLALVLRRVEGLTLTEVAVHLDISLATAKRRIQAAEVLLAGHLRKPRSR